MSSIACLKGQLLFQVRMKLSAEMSENRKWECGAIYIYLTLSLIIVAELFLDKYTIQLWQNGVFVTAKV